MPKMPYRKIGKSEINARVKQFLVALLHIVTLLMGSGAFLTALWSVSTEERPSGDAALWAPVIAFCVALLYIFQFFELDGGGWRWTRGISMALGSMMSAILWIADGAGAHPTDVKLWSDFGVVWVFAGVVALVLTIFFLAMMWHQEER